MSEKPTPEAIKARIKQLKLTMEAAAKRMGITRATLYEHLGRPELSDYFVYSFKEKIGMSDIPDATVEGTPVYDLHATAGANDNTSQLPEVPNFHVKIPGYEDCNFGMYVYGHSMYPTVENGSLILCRKVKDKTVIMYGEIYLIRTEDYLMVKRLQKNHQVGYVLCTSDNYEKRAPDFKRFEPIDMSIDKIIDLYLVKGIIKKTQS